MVPAAATKRTQQLAVTGQKRVQVLYEEYIHLRQLKQVWEAPVTEKPALEPLFTAGFHGIELAFLMMATFIEDGRGYVAKRPRIEAMADDIRAQCQLLGELVDGELEVEGVPSRMSLTQDFPFEGCPPTTSSPGHSPGLARLVAAVKGAVAIASPAERNSLVKVSLNIAQSFTSSFSRWTVGLGIEGQLVELVSAATGGDGSDPLLTSTSTSRASTPTTGQSRSSTPCMERGIPLAASQCVGLLWRARRPGAHYLDYNALVRPHVVEATLTGEVYSNAEDFFFRTVHLGTECWMFAANALASYGAEHAANGAWHVAAARTALVTRILHYLGDHILTLTRMNLRDYLQLKVQLEGTSGAGSSQVRAIKGLVLALMGPLRDRALALSRELRLHLPGGSSSGSSTAGGGSSVSCSSAEGTSEEESGNEGAAGGPIGGSRGRDVGGGGGKAGGGEWSGEGEEDAAVLAGVMHIYAHPDKFAGLYNYAKALEDAESGLLGGFFYKHYLLATNVIGSAARGTMRRAVGALKAGYEKPLFPVLDAARCALGARFDAELAHMRGKMMDEIIERYLAEASGRSPPTPQPPPTHATTAAAAAVLGAALGAAATAAATAATATASDPVGPTAPAVATAAAGAPAAAPSPAPVPGANSSSAHNGTHGTAVPTAAISAAAAVALQAATVAAAAAQHAEELDTEAQDGVAQGMRTGTGGCPFLSSTACSAIVTAPDACPFGIRGSSGGSGNGHAHAQPPTASPHAGGGRSKCPFSFTAEPEVPLSTEATEGQAVHTTNSKSGNGHIVVPRAPVTAVQRADAQPQEGKGVGTRHEAGEAVSSEGQVDRSGPDLSRIEAVRSHLYSLECVPPAFKDMEQDATREALAQLHALRGSSSSGGGPTSDSAPPLAFLSHAWGATPPRVKAAALKRFAGLSALGNAAWDVVFGSLMPQASDHVLRLLGLPQVSNPQPTSGPDGSAAGQQQPVAHVHWGSNSHELVWRAASVFMERPVDAPPMRVLTSDTEFYSLTRQLNRLSQQQYGSTTSHNTCSSSAGSTSTSSLPSAPSSGGSDEAKEGTRFAFGVHVDWVAAEPAATFPERLVTAAKAQRYDLVYVSQVTYLTQRTLLPDVEHFVSELSDSLASQLPDMPLEHNVTASPPPPLIIVDGYHGFGAVPTSLGAAFHAPAIQSGRVGLAYVSGLLKHMACGPGAAFMVLSSGWCGRPLFTGWLADPSVLAPASAGVGPGSPVGYFPPLALHGSTPGYLLPAVMFCELMAAWSASSSHSSHDDDGPAGGTASTVMDNSTMTDSTGISVQDVHTHVVSLQRRFLRGWTRVSEVNVQLLGGCWLVNVAEVPSTQSHTLVMECASAQQAARVVAAVEARGVQLDTRKCFVRFGFGFNHSTADVDTLLQALETAR